MSLEEVLVHVRAAMAGSTSTAHTPGAGLGTRAKRHVELSGTRVKVSSLRLRVFARHGTTCSSCGLVASYFAIEKPARSMVANEGWHLNLYGTRADGSSVLFTQDHTLARSLGGADTLDNTTTMCAACNAHKSLAESAECTRRDRSFVIVHRKTRALMTDPHTQQAYLAPTLDAAQAYLTPKTLSGFDPADWVVDTHAHWWLERNA